MQIYLVDDNLDNIISLELLIDEYFEENNIDLNQIKVTSFSSPKKALEEVIKNEPEIVFLDIMMPEIDGFEMLKRIRESDIDQPIIIMATALGDEQTKQKEKKLKANAYMVKPFSKVAVKAMLDRYLLPKLDKEQIEENEDFFDLDFDDVEFNSEAMENLNKSHKKVSAVEFLSKYDSEIDESYIEDVIDDINEIIFLLEDNRFDEAEDQIVISLDRFSKFLNMFIEFEELYEIVYNVLILFEKLDFEKIKKKEIFVNFIIAFFSDLLEWVKHVFIEKDTVDVYYLNASLYNSYIQLRNLAGGGRLIENKNII